MMQFSRWVVAKTISEVPDPKDMRFRSRVGLLEGWTSVALNIGLFALKGLLGLLTGSISLIADSLHTLSDSLTSLVVILGFRIARKPADSEHPFGHGRMESISGLIIGVLLAMMALEMFIASVNRLVRPQPVTAEAWMIGVLFVSLVIKELQTRFARDLGHLISSPTLHADAWHHRSDVFATALVIVALLAARWDIAWLDGAMGIGVAVMIAWASLTSARSSRRDSAPPSKPASRKSSRSSTSSCTSSLLTSATSRLRIRRSPMTDPFSPGWAGHSAEMR